MFLLVAASSFAQNEPVMEVYTFQQHKTENSDPKKNRTTIFISGIQSDTVIDVKMVTSQEGILELRINGKNIPNNAIANHQNLTDFIADYAKMPRKKVAPADIPTTAPPKQVPYNNVNDWIIAELKADGLIGEDTNVFDVVISYDKMFFNGKEQSADLFKKYKKIYEEKSGRKIERTTYYHLSQTL